MEGGHAETREVYPASEGFIALADRGPGEGLRLMIDNGLFFEFVPLSELDSPNPTRHWLENAEIGVTYAAVLRTILRQDPDIILVGEMRDLETISTALTAAETGHLVFATLHTQDAPQSIDRIIDVFPSHQQQQIRVQLAATLQGIVTQQLVPTADGKGRAVAAEVLVATPAIRNLIREGKIHQIYSLMQTGAKHGMVTMDQSLASLVSSEIANLTALKSKIEAETDLSVLKGDVKSITNSYRIFALVIPQGRIEVAADKIADVASSLTTLSGKLQARIDTAQPDRKPLPKADIRQYQIGMGPVVVFTGEPSANTPFPLLSMSSCCRYAVNRRSSCAYGSTAFEWAPNTLWYHTPSMAMITGRLCSKGAVRKWVSMVWKPARKSANSSGPMAIISDRPMAESTE